MEIIWRVISWEEETGEWEKTQGLRSIIGRCKIDRGMSRIVLEMEKPKNLHDLCLIHGHEQRGDFWIEWGYRVEASKRGKLRQL